MQEVLEGKLLQLEEVHTDENWSDVITKVLPTKKFEDYYKATGVVFPN